MPEAHQQQRYRVIEKLASGGMAEVFRAESAGLEGFKKQVAIKRVLPHLSEKKKFISMFLDEARLSAHLSHSNCVQVFDIGVGDNAYFIVMEYVDGADLKAVLETLKKQGRDDPRRRRRCSSPSRSARASATRTSSRITTGKPLRHRPPRHVAAQRAHHQVRRGEDRGLRSRQGVEPAREERAGHHQGQVQLPLARGGARQGGRPPHRHLRGRASSSGRCSRGGASSSATPTSPR